MTRWPVHPTIFEINTVVWLDELSRQNNNPVTLASIPDSIVESLAKAGFHAVWLMGVWERSPESILVSNENTGLLSEFLAALPDFTIEDNIGSAYAIRQYRVDPRLGGNQALATFRDRLHAHGLKLILDFVPNHVARDHPWVSDHPEFFIQGSAVDLLGAEGGYFESNQSILACGRDPNFPPWQDTAQINLFHSGARLAAANTLDEIAQYCDGVRCDMAMLCLNEIFFQTWGERAGTFPGTEYWRDVIMSTHIQHPDFLFLAEAYWGMEPELLKLGFDACYDKVLYDRLIHGQADDLLDRLSNPSLPPSRLVHFIENHDEQRARKVFPIRKEMLAAVTVATVPGMMLIHEGQMEGRRSRIPVFLRRRQPEQPDPDRQAFYQTLLKIAASPVCQDGEWRICSRQGWEDNQSLHNLAAWSWHFQDEMLLVVINYSDHPSQSQILLPWEHLIGSRWRLVDLIKGTTYQREGDELVDRGLFVDLPGWDFHLLWCSAKQAVPNVE